MLLKINKYILIYSICIYFFGFLLILFYYSRDTSIAIGKSCIFIGSTEVKKPRSAVRLSSREKYVGRKNELSRKSKKNVSSGVAVAVGNNETQSEIGYILVGGILCVFSCVNIEMIKIEKL